MERRSGSRIWDFLPVPHHFSGNSGKWRGGLLATEEDLIERPGPHYLRPEDLMMCAAEPLQQSARVPKGTLTGMTQTPEAPHVQPQSKQTPSPTFPPLSRTPAPNPSATWFVSTNVLGWTYPSLVFRCIVDIGFNITTGAPSRVPQSTCWGGCSNAVLATRQMLPTLKVWVFDTTAYNTWLFSRLTWTLISRRHDAARPA